MAYTVLPYFGKRKQVTYHPNLSYWCFHISSNVHFFQAKFYAETLILLRDVLGKTSWYSIDVSVNDRHILLFYKKCHFCHLLPFAKVGQSTQSSLGHALFLKHFQFGEGGGAKWAKGFVRIVLFVLFFCRLEMCGFFFCLSLILLVSEDFWNLLVSSFCSEITYF